MCFIDYLNDQKCKCATLFPIVETFRTNLAVIGKVIHGVIHLFLKILDLRSSHCLLSDLLATRLDHTIDHCSEAAAGAPVSGSALLL